MTEEETKHIEGAAALDLQHHDTTKKTFRLVATFFVFWLICTGASRAHSGDWFWNHSSSRLALHQEIAKLKADVSILENELKNQSWLWNSHDSFNALCDDDPKYLKNGCHEFFLANSPKSRIEGFNRIINDGLHPNLKKWNDARGQ